MSKIKIFYGSAGGNTELVCQKVAAILSEKNAHEVILCPTRESSAKDVKGYDIVVFASPTYGHGTLEMHFEKFLKDCESLDLKGKKYAVIGLGDAKYDADHLVASAKIIDEFFVRKEAVKVSEPLKVYHSPVPYLDTLVADWAKKFKKLA